MASFWPRINTVLVLITLFAVIGLFASRALGGPLDPPGAPTTGTDGVRGPGTPISSLPFTTTDSGYYYVTRPLSAPFGQPGITICCSNTTIDLGGFTITGGLSPGDGISNPGNRNIVIRNGAVRGFSYGINLGGSYSRVENVQALSNSVVGILVGSESEVVNCAASLSGQTGVVISYGAVRNCTISENATGIGVGAYSLVEGNRVQNNNGNGIMTTGDFSTIRNNVADSNLANDIVATSTGIAVRDNVYCDSLLTGPNLVATGNIDRVDAC